MRLVRSALKVRQDRRQFVVLRIAKPTWRGQLDYRFSICSNASNIVSEGKLRLVRRVELTQSVYRFAPTIEQQEANSPSGGRIGNSSAQPALPIILQCTSHPAPFVLVDVT